MDGISSSLCPRFFRCDLQQAKFRVLYPGALIALTVSYRTAKRSKLRSCLPARTNVLASGASLPSALQTGC